MTLKRRILLGLVLFAGVGWVTRRLQGEPPPPPAMAPVLRRVAEIERSLRDACQRSAQLAARPPASMEARAAAIAELERGRRTALAAEDAFRKLPVTAGLRDVAEVRQGLEAKARMAALSAQAMQAAAGVVRGEAGAQPRMSALQASANRSAEEATRLMQAAIRKAGSAR